MERKENLKQMILESPATHYWVKDIIRLMETKDIFDNVKNAEILLEVAKSEYAKDRIKEK